MRCASGLARNAVTVLANRRDPRYKALFTRVAREHPDPAVREHAAWAPPSFGRPFGRIEAATRPGARPTSEHERPADTRIHGEPLFRPVGRLVRLLDVGATLAAAPCAMAAAARRAGAERGGSHRCRESSCDAEGVFAEATKELRTCPFDGRAPRRRACRAVRYELARVLIDQRKFHEALAACQGRRLPKRKSGAGLGHACLREAQMLRRRATEALPEVELALAATPNSMTPWSSRAGACAARVSSRRPSHSPRRMRARMPTARRRSSGLAKFSSSRASGLAALEAFQKAKSAEPDDPDAVYAVGRAVAPVRRRSPR